MASLDVDTLLGDMLQAAAAAAGVRWMQVKDSVTPQFAKLAEIAVKIERLKNSCGIDEEEAQSLVRIQEQSARAVAAGLEGQLKLVTEAAINAALGVLTAALRRATGFGFL